jgi:hypothetical protein
MSDAWQFIARAARENVTKISISSKTNVFTAFDETQSKEEQSKESRHFCLYIKKSKTCK